MLQPLITRAIHRRAFRAAHSGQAHRLQAGRVSRQTWASGSVPRHHFRGAFEHLMTDLACNCSIKLKPPLAEQVQTASRSGSGLPEISLSIMMDIADVSRCDCRMIVPQFRRDFFCLLTPTIACLGAERKCFRQVDCENFHMTTLVFAWGNCNLL